MKALTLLNKSLTLNPQEHKALFERAWVFYRIQKYNNAIDLFLHASPTGPGALCKRPGMALKVCVSILTPSSNAALAVVAFAAECPKETTIWLFLKNEITSRAPFTSGARVTRHISSSKPCILFFSSEIEGSEIYSN